MACTDRHRLSSGQPTSPAGDNSHDHFWSGSVKPFLSNRLSSLFKNPQTIRPATPNPQNIQPADLRLKISEPVPTRKGLSTVHPILDEKPSEISSWARHSKPCFATEHVQQIQQLKEELAQERLTHQETKRVLHRVLASVWDIRNRQNQRCQQLEQAQAEQVTSLQTTIEHLQRQCLALSEERLDLEQQLAQQHAQSEQEIHTLEQEKVHLLDVAREFQQKAATVTAAADQSEACNQLLTQTLEKQQAQQHAAEAEAAQAKADCQALALGLQTAQQQLQEAEVQTQLQQAQQYAAEAWAAQAKADCYVSALGFETAQQQLEECKAQSQLQQEASERQAQENGCLRISLQRAFGMIDLATDEYIMADHPSSKEDYKAKLLEQAALDSYLAEMHYGNCSNEHLGILGVDVFTLEQRLAELVHCSDYDQADLLQNYLSKAIRARIHEAQDIVQSQDLPSLRIHNEATVNILSSTLEGLEAAGSQF